MSALTIAVRYALFAVLATAANLLVQHAVLAALDLSLFASSLALPTAMTFGTGAGLVTKYVLDRRWIFRSASSGLGPQGQEFGLYALTGVVTTALFWGTELAFATFEGVFMRDLGAVLGLAAGYVAKYHLDRRFVFTARTA